MEQETKLGVNWKGSLEFLLNLQNQVYSDYHNYILALKKLGNVGYTRKMLETSLASFYLSINLAFNKYLKEKTDKKDKKENNKKKITKEDYIKLPIEGVQDSIKLLLMVSEIMEFSQKAGISAINVKEDGNPNEALGDG